MERRTRRRSILFALVVLCAAVSQAEATSSFRIAVLPDTQYYSQNNVAYPNSSLFHDQVNWILANRETQRIAFVTHLGDVVNVAGGAGAASSQWPVAQSAMQKLKDSSLPFNILPGNHDWTSAGGTGSVEHYRSRFGDQADYFAGKNWFVGYDQRGINSAVKFETPIGPMINISLEFNATSPTAISGAPANPIAWAQSIIDANKGVPTIISTHNSINPGSGRDGFGQSLFKQLVRDNNQVFMVLNGHYNGNDNEQDLTSLNSYGRAVFERGVDYQNNANGGDGWMNLIEFDPDAKKIRLSTFSPKNNADLSGDTGGAAGSSFGNVGTVRTDYDSRFERDFDVARRFSPVSTQAKTRPLSFQQGVNGYAGTLDTKIDLATPAAVSNSSSVMTVEQDTTAAMTSQALIKFDNLFGSGGGQVAGDRDIQRATLRVYVDANVSNSQGSGLLLHRMLTPWGASATWDSLNAGVAPDGIEAVYWEEDSAGASNSGENVKKGTWVELDVTDSLRAMRQGAPNHGWALLPWNGGTNAAMFNSSEASDAATRPQLVVDVTSDPVVARSFRNGVNAYNSASDTWIDAASPGTARADDPLIRVDAMTTPAGDAQSLLRFDGIIGQGAGQIPEDDVRITSAMLTVNVSSDNVNAEGSGLSLHRMRQEWSDADTWNSMAGGVVTGINATTTPDDTLGEDANVVALKPGRQYIDVSSSLRAWTEEGEANLGWALLPTEKGTNAVMFDSVESALANRPELIVRYQQLAPAQWSANATSGWEDPQNWLNGEVPQGVGRTAVFGPKQSATTVTLNDHRTIGTLRLENPSGHAILGSGSLTLQRLTQPARVQVLAGDNLIAADLNVVGDVEFSIANAASLAVTGDLNAQRTARLSKSGAGALAIDSVAVRTLQVNEGELQLISGLSRTEMLVLGDDARLVFAGGALAIDYAGGSPIDLLIEDLMRSAIRAASSSQAVACVEAAQRYNAAELFELGMDDTTLLLASALRGDATLDGRVDFADLLVLAQHYGDATTSVGWLTGDFNYDSTVDFGDLLALAQHYGADNLLTQKQFQADWQLARSMVPEPASMTPIMVALLARRRGRTGR